MAALFQAAVTLHMLFGGVKTFPGSMSTIGTIVSLIPQRDLNGLRTLSASILARLPLSTRKHERICAAIGITRIARRMGRAKRNPSHWLRKKACPH